MKMKIDDVELYYELHGKGEPIVFSHGWLEDCSIWSSQVEHFAKNNTVILYDHRGHGRSDKPKGEYSLQVLSNDLHSLIQKLRLEKVTLVGFSLGGMAALVFTLEHPDKVSKLILVGTTAKMALFPLLIVRVLRYVLPYKTVARMMCRWRFYKPSEQMVEDELARAMRVDSYVAYECLKAFTKNYDVRDRVSKIEVPTLVIVGEKDKINLEASRYLNREIKGSELQIMPGFGHTVMIENPEEFNRILEEFVRSEN